MPQWTETVALDGSRTSLNGMLRGARNKTMLAVLGNPRGDYSGRCQPITNELMRSLVRTEDLGPFRATGIKPALRVLRVILEEVRASEPDIHSRLGTEGMLCARFVTGSTSSISNHSWGSAIDLTLNGALDRRGDNHAQRGLLQIHPIFNRHGFFWGAAFPVEDAMHFEASDDLILQWQAEGEFGGARPTVSTPSLLEFGDRDAAVAAVQQMLSAALGVVLKPDGIFGPATRASVLDLQARKGLPQTGAVDSATLAALRATQPAPV